MKYGEITPVPELADIVDCLWTLEGHASRHGEPEPVLPDGRPELVLHFGDPFERLEPGNVVERQPSVIYAGQLTRQLLLRPTGRIAVLGVRFLPHGATAILRAPQHELAGLTIALDALSPRLRHALAAVQDSAADMAEAVSLVQGILLRWVDRSRADARVRFAVAAIDRTRGRISIDRLADDTGLTCRHLERRFLAVVGVTPKRLARIARFQHALRMLGRADPRRRGTDTAAACGYADQSHFIRDFRRLAGCAPGEHLLTRGELTGFFIERA